MFECKSCSILCSKKSDWLRHTSTIKHKNSASDEKKTPLHCVSCNKMFSNKYEVNKHLKTKSHIKNIIGIDENTTINTDIPDILAEVLKSNIELQKQNIELQKQMLEICNKPNTTINNTTNNTNTQKFNINVFLNETCKDAINFSDFVKNIQISYKDLENNAQLGFVGGISKIFIDNLKQLDITERPIHCTDVKRETIYIRDENTWTKQPDDEKLKKAIQTVSYRSMGKLAEWKEENPDYKDCNSEFSQKCIDIHRNTLAGSDREVYYPKVIHAVAREIAGGLYNKQYPLSYQPK